jgi:signal transduction histidine kinase
MDRILMAPQQENPTAPASTEALEAFANQVAHDLRNILNNLSLSLQFLELTLDLEDPMTTRAITRMRDEVNKLRRLAEELPARASDHPS